MIATKKTRTAKTAVRATCSTVGVSSPILDIQAAWLCNAMEENENGLAVAEKGVKFTISPYEIATVRVLGKQQERRDPHAS